MAWDQNDGNLAVYTLYNKTTKQQASNICSQASSTKQAINHRGVFKMGNLSLWMEAGIYWLRLFPIDNLHQLYKSGSFMSPCQGWLKWVLFMDFTKIKRNNRIQLNMVQPNDSIHTRIRPTAQLPVHKKVIVQVFTVISIQQFPKAILSRWRSHNKTPNISPAKFIDSLANKTQETTQVWICFINVLAPPKTKMEPQGSAFA